MIILSQTGITEKIDGKLVISLNISGNIFIISRKNAENPIFPGYRSLFSGIHLVGKKYLIIDSIPHIVLFDTIQIIGKFMETRCLSLYS